MHKILLVLLCSIFAIAACGQKGPLFLPGDPSTIQTEVPAQEEAEEEKDEEIDEENENQ